MSPLLRKIFWREDFFAPIDAKTVGLLRIFFGVVSIFYFMWWVPTAGFWLTNEGFVSSTMAWNYSEHFNVISPFRFVENLYQAIALLVIGVAASFSMVVGWHSRISTFIVMILVVGIQNRASSVIHGGEQLVRVALIYLSLADTGAALSLDAFKQPLLNRRYLVPIYPVRLLQFTVFTMYLTAVLHKLKCITWVNGTAIGYALLLREQTRFAMPEFFTYFPITHMMTWGTLFIQSGMFMAILIPKLRPIFFPLGVLLHLSIEVIFNIPFFSIPVLASYFAFKNNGLTRLSELIVQKIEKTFDRKRKKSSQNISSVKQAA